MQNKYEVFKIRQKCRLLETLTGKHDNNITEK